MGRETLADGECAVAIRALGVIQRWTFLLTDLGASGCEAWKLPSDL
jgi:hypothetical protein